jgi:hypothetical protein
MPTKIRCYPLSLSLNSLSFLLSRLGSVSEGLIIYFVKTMWVMNCCITLSLNYSFIWCTCLKLFEFGLGFEFDLKSIEKTKRKAIRNSRKKGKPIQPSRPTSAQSHARSPVPTCPPLPNRRSPPVSVAPACTLPLSLSLSGGVDLSASVLSAYARLLSLSRGPRSSALKPVHSPALSLSLFCGPRLSKPSPPNCKQPKIQFWDLEKFL